MPIAVGRNPFARGEYERTCHGQGECDWCGQTRRRVFSYLWVSDGSNSSHAMDHVRNKLFCNFECFTSFYS